MADVLMAGVNPARTGFQAETLGATVTFSWRFRHQELATPEKVAPQIQPLVTGGYVLLPTLAGKLRSFSPTTGAVQWTADVGAPVVSTPVADATNVYVADIFGRLSAFKLTDGTAASGWSNPVQVTAGRSAPIQGHLLLADAKILFGDAAGKIHGRSVADGSAAWTPYACGAQILQGGAYSAVSGTKTFVIGAMDVKLYAVNTATGALLWSRQATGSAFKDFWPIIHEGLGTPAVFARPQARETFWQGGVPSSLQTPIRAIEADFGTAGAQDAALAAYDASPSSYQPNVALVNLATGAMLSLPIHYWFAITMHGAPFVGCLDVGGHVVSGVNRPTGQGGPDFTGGWGTIDLATRKVVDSFYDAAYAHSYWNRDENVAVAACTNGVVAMHNQESNAQTTGFYRQTDGTWHPFGYLQATPLFENTQGGGSSQPSISGGKIYHNARPHTLVCWATA